MSDIQISFSIWYPGAEFWSHPLWFWYMVIGVINMSYMCLIVACYAPPHKRNTSLKSLSFLAKSVFLWPLKIKWSLMVRGKCLEAERMGKR